MPVFPDAAFLTLAPDWLCELLSPSTRASDLNEKRALYARAGGAHLWLVNPDAPTLEAFTLTAGAWTLAAFQAVPPSRP
jgi:Uma2 family endonuclease